MDSNTQKRNKRGHNELSDSDTEHHASPQFPRFLIIQSEEEHKQLASLSPFVIEKQIESLAGVPKTVKKLNDKYEIKLVHLPIKFNIFNIYLSIFSINLSKRFTRKDIIFECLIIKRLKSKIRKKLVDGERKNIKGLC